MKTRKTKTPKLKNEGNQELSLWFGLSYASFCVLPRVLMEAMPDKWQEQMAKLLFEWYNFYPNQPDLGTRVQITKNKKLIKTPDWIINYKYPDWEIIRKIRNENKKNKNS